MPPGVCMADFNAIAAENAALKDKAAALMAELSASSEQASLRQGARTGSDDFVVPGDVALPPSVGRTDVTAMFTENATLRAEVQSLKDTNGRTEVLAEMQYYKDQRVISELRAAALLSGNDAASADVIAASPATAEEVNSLIPQIDETWRAIIDEEKRVNIEAQRASAEAQAESIAAQTENAELQAEVQELQSKLFLARAAATAGTTNAVNSVRIRLRSGS